MNRYRDIQIFNNLEQRKRYRTNPMYPYIPLSENDIYFISTEGDRYDILSDRFYNTPELWWIIASANNATTDDLAIKPGIQVRIPSDKNNAIRLFIEYNELR